MLYVMVCMHRVAPTSNTSSTDGPREIHLGHVCCSTHIRHSRCCCCCCETAHLGGAGGHSTGYLPHTCPARSGVGCWFPQHMHITCQSPAGPAPLCWVRQPLTHTTCVVAPPAHGPLQTAGCGAGKSGQRPLLHLNGVCHVVHVGGWMAGGHFCWVHAWLGGAGCAQQTAQRGLRPAELLVVPHTHECSAV